MAMRSNVLAIGCGAGFSGDRVDAAGPVVDTMIARGHPSVLIFEMLAERTLALAQLARRADPAAGYEPLLDLMLTPILKKCVLHNIPIVSNFGAANPRAAAKRIQQLAKEQGLGAIRVAVIEGDDLLANKDGTSLLDKHLEHRLDDQEVVSANVYIGAVAIADALRAGAQVVVAGRVADPSLAVGPAMAHFNWSETDWQMLGAATFAGHLLECGAQVTGGYFADPGMKDVPELHSVGYPIVEISEDGSFEITKADGTGGVVSTRTVKEQLLYEVHDPAAYLTPDVTADISQATVQEVAKDRVRMTGIRGHLRPEHLKVNVCYAGGWLGEGEISYAGPNAEARARLAAEVVRKRMGDRLHLRADLIGVLSVFGDDGGQTYADTVQGAQGEIRDVRVRIAATHRDKALVDHLLREVVALYTCGPAGGGGVRTAIRPRLNTVSCLIPRSAITPTFTMVE
jgi:hypothetical protein